MRWVTLSNNATYKVPEYVAMEIERLQKIETAAMKVKRWIGWTIDCPGLQTQVRICRDSHREAAEAVRELSGTLPGIDLVKFHEAIK